MLSKRLILLSMLAATPLLGETTTLTMDDRVYGIQRTVWIVKSPSTLDTSKGDYNLVILLPGAWYANDVDAPGAIDALAKAGKIGPTVAAIIDTSDLLPANLATRVKWAGFMAGAFMPWLQAQFGALPKASRVTIGGASVGGITAAYVAFRHPELFGNVIAQSGAFWRGNEGSSDPPEWLIAQLRSSPRLPIRFYIEVGAGETQIAPNGLVFIEANRHLRDVLREKGYVVQYVEVPGAKHEPTHWRAALPAALTYVAAPAPRPARPAAEPHSRVR